MEAAGLALNLLFPGCTFPAASADPIKGEMRPEESASVLALNRTMWLVSQPELSGA